MAQYGSTELRQDLITCSALLVFKGILDYSGHLSARIPGTEYLLIQPRDFSRTGLRPEDLVVVDFQGNLIEGEVPPPAEVAIHTGVYRHRDDVNFVCHGHPTLSTSFSMTDQPLLPMRHFAYKHGATGPKVHPDFTHIYTNEQGDAVAATLGDSDAILLRSHGTVVVAPTVQRLFMDCLDLEENAATLLNARQAGGNLRPLTEEDVAALAESYGKTSHRPNKVWQHYIGLGKAAGVL